MSKLLSFFLYVVIIGGGCNMSNAISDVNAAATPSEDKNIKLIAEHIEKNLSLPAEKFSITVVRAKDLPAGVAQYYAEEKNVDHGKAFTYLISDGKLYSSGVDGDLGRFLKDQGFLENDKLDSTWLKVIISKFIDLRDQLLIDEGRIANPREALKPFLSKIAAPKLTKSADGADYVFFTHSVTVQPVRKFAVKIASDYNVTVNNEIVTA